MTTQFADEASGDVKLFVDFTERENFRTKFNFELLPRLEKGEQRSKRLRSGTPSDAELSGNSFPEISQRRKSTGTLSDLYGLAKMRTVRKCR